MIDLLKLQLIIDEGLDVIEKNIKMCGFKIDSHSTYSRDLDVGEVDISIIVSPIK